MPALNDEAFPIPEREVDMQTKLSGLFAMAILATGTAAPRPAIALIDDGSLFDDLRPAAESVRSAAEADCAVDAGDGAFGQAMRNAWRFGVCSMDSVPLHPLDRNPDDEIVLP